MTSKGLCHTAGGLLLLALAVSAVRPLAAQELPLRRDVPAPAPRACSAAAADVVRAQAQDEHEAARIAASAREASLLGDLRTARDLLDRAARLDPSAESVAFLYARTLEELGDVDGAAREYCRYAQLTDNAAEAEQVRERVRRIAPATRPGIPDSAAARFTVALSAADVGRLSDAEQAFSDVVASAPTWAAPYYNRALLRARSNHRDEARADLEQFLTLEPAAPDAQRVRGWIAQLSEPVRHYSAGASFALGLVPGAGHFYTGRPLMGAAMLAIGAGAAAAGVLYQTRTVDCLGPPENGVCPPDQVRDERTERPYLVPALGVAAGASILGAIDAALGARRRNSRGPVLSAGSVGAQSFLLPAVHVTPTRVNVALLRLRF